jgi:hypothetical protein
MCVSSQVLMMMWQVTRCFLKVQYLEHLPADMQNILGLYQQWNIEEEKKTFITVDGGASEQTVHLEVGPCSL